MSGKLELLAQNRNSLNNALCYLAISGQILATYFFMLVVAVVMYWQCHSECRRAFKDQEEVTILRFFVWLLVYCARDWPGYFRRNKTIRILSEFILRMFHACVPFRFVLLPYSG